MTTPVESARGGVFLDLFFALREQRVPVTAGNWLAFLDALGRDLHDSSLDGMYEIGRAVLCGSEVHYDGFDRAFSHVFRGVTLDVAAFARDLERFLADPKLHPGLDPELRALMEHLDLDELRERLRERLANQRERHEGGARHIGTGGTSPFGQGGVHPTGIRMGGQGGGRSALAVADARRYREFRNDRVLDTRQIAAALRKLKKLAHRGEMELDIDATIDATAKNAGDLEIVERRERRNDVRVLLLFDVGGSMDPHAQVVERIFSAATRGGGFREIRSYYFHNCPYGRVYERASFTGVMPIDRLLRELDDHWILIMVGDAWMHPAELSMGDADVWSMRPGIAGYAWLAKLAERFVRAAWLNPEPSSQWSAPSIAAIRRLFAMYESTLDGIDAMVAGLRRPAPPERRAFVDAVLRESALR